MFGRQVASRDVTPKPLTDERDYLWERAKLGTSPQRVHYRDLPIVGTGGSFNEVGAVKSALAQLASGQFLAAAQLCDDFSGDDRIGALLETRIEALASLPVEVEASTRSSDKGEAQDIATRVESEWSTWFSNAEVKRLHEWGLNLGFGIGELLWDTTSPGYWAPRLKTWDLRYCSWRWDTRSFWMTTMDGQVEVRPGDGHWVVYAPHGYTRPWMRGLVRPFALPYMTRHWTQRDWARWCEVHGLPIRVGIVPVDAEPAAKDSFIHDLLYIGGEAVIRAEQDETTKTKYDVKLVEAASQSWEGFQRLLEKCDENLAIRVLGQNLTTSVKGGGSYGAADVHDRIRRDRVESDAKSLGACLTEQAVRPWCVYNYAGGEDLVPRATWSTRPPEDRAAAAKTLNDLGAAVVKLKDAGFPVDLEALAKQFRVPLSAVVQATHGQLYEYHLKYGIVTKNEARGRLGYEPRPDGDVYVVASETSNSSPGGLGDEEPEEDAEVEPEKNEDKPDA